MPQKTKVIFRKFNYGEVIAIFPEIPGTNDPSTCQSYSHIGQHGSCNPNMLVDLLKLATEADYNDLYAELTSIGYDLQVIKRLRYSHLETRKAELNRIRE